MADGRITIDSRIQTQNLRGDAQEVNNIMRNMSNNIASSSNTAGRQSEQAFTQMGNNVRNSVRGMESSTNQAYRAMGSTAQQTYSQMNGYGQSAYRQQQEAARMAYNSMSAESRAMHTEMREAWRAQSMAMGPMRDQMMQTEYGYFKLAQASATYRGSTEQFMGTVRQLGAEQKRAADAAINGNRLAMTSMLQTAGTMMNMSTQAEKITANYERMNNPLLRINAGGLAAANSLNRLALAGNASVLALKMLGPNASMKALVDMQNMIMQGQMRIGMVAMASAVTAVAAYSMLWKAAVGPDPSTVYAAQEKALQKYKDAVVQRTTEIVNAWNIFEKAQLKAANPATLMKNLQGQVDAMTQWNANLNSIASRTSKEFADYLSSLGPTAAGEVAAVNSMTQPELDKYVALWQEKTRLAKERAMTELEGMKAETMAKIKELGDTLTPLGLAFEKFKQVWTEALEPMVQAFSNVMTPLVEFGTKIGELVIKFNEANPTMAMFIQGAIMLVPLLTLMLSPLAAGVGLFNGIKVAMAGAWAIIGPLVTGLGAMSATVWVVAAAIAGLAIGFVALWNNSETFRNGVIAGWEAIKAAAIAVWNFLLDAVIRPVMEAVGTYVGEKLAQIQAFWSENGAAIMALAQETWQAVVTIIQTVMAVIGPFLQIAWENIKMVVQVVWEAIKTVIDLALVIIGGLIKAWVALANGDFQGAWDAIKEIWNSALEIIKNFLKNAMDIISNNIKNVMDIIKNTFQTVWEAIKGVINTVVTAIVTWIKNKWEEAKNNIKSVMDAIKQTFDTVWNAIKTFISNVINNIKQDIDQKWNAIKTFLSVVINAIKSDIDAKWNAIKAFLSSVMDAIKSVMQTVWNAIKSVVKTVIDAIKSVIESVWNGIKSFISSVMDGIKTVFSTVWNAIKNVVKTVLDAIKNTVQNGMDAAKNIVSTVGNAIKTAFTNIWNGFKDIVSKTFDTVKSAITSGLKAGVEVVKNFGSTFMEAGKGLIDMMAQGIKNAASAVTDAIGDLASKARDFLPFSPAKTGPLSDIDKLDFGGPISDSIHRATKGIQVNLASMLELPVIGATGGGMTRSVANSTINNNNGGNTNVITVQIDPSNMSEFEQVVEFFNTFQQTKRKRG